MKKIFFFSIVMMACALSANAEVKVATFENEDGGIYISAGNPYWYGVEPLVSDENYWVSGDYNFVTFNDDAWGPSYYYDFVVSNDKSNVFVDWSTAYRSAQGGAYAGDNFAVWYNNFYGNSPIVPNEIGVIPGCFVCNCAYTVNSMANGDGYCQKFTKDSYYRILFIGMLNDVETDTVIVPLAENGTYIDKWTYVDLTPLGSVDQVAIAYESSDYGTPTYFCLDNFGATKPDGYVEPARAKFDLPATFENENGGINVAHADTCWQGADDPLVGTHMWESGDYTFASYTSDWGGGYLGYSGITVSSETSSSFTGYEYYRSASGGAYEGANFAVWTDPWSAEMDMTCVARVIPGFFVNNAAYAVNSMNNGDSYAKKFGAEDWFKLTITGYKDGTSQGTVDFYLAKEGKYVDQWTYVDLSTLGEIDAIKFSMSSSDTGDFGMNTPAYFCMDNFGVAMPVGYIAPEMAEFDLSEGINQVQSDKVQSTKVLLNGQIYILRGEHLYNATGAMIR